nr:MAG TPA: helix-turn-helix XRE-family like protein [Caudoviricetes sp.]
MRKNFMKKTYELNVENAPGYLRELRKHKGMSMIDASYNFGCSPTSLYKWEHGTVSPQVSTYLELINMYGGEVYICLPTDCLLNSEASE